MKVYRIILIFVIAILARQSPAQTITAGDHHSLFLCNNNGLMACGYNDRGQLGDNTTTQKNSPVQVNVLSGIIAMAAGVKHSLFLKNDNTVWACGFNGYGQLGNGSTASDSISFQINGLIGIIGISAGGSNSLFLKNDGTVWACGNNQYGQLGNGTTSGPNPNPVPAQLSSLSGIIAIAEGDYYHSLFLKNDGTVWACGLNDHGQLGNGTTSNANPTPFQVPSLSGIIAIAAGQGYSLFLKNDSTVWACGIGGALGNGLITDQLSPVQAVSLSKITAIAAGNGHSMFLKNDGTVWVCGSNLYGQLGNGTSDVNPHSTPIQASSLSGITSIAAGQNHSLFLKNDGTVWACGDNGLGQLGDGTGNNKSTPVQVTGLCSLTAVEENSIENNISVYPNPLAAQTTFTLNKEAKNALLKVYDMNGKIARQLIFSGMQVIFQKENIVNGIYFYQIISGDKIIAAGKLIVE